MNEPADPQHHNLQTWYRQVEKAIREVDPDHILFLDGNTYSMDFTGFKEVLPNCVYSIVSGLRRIASVCWTDHLLYSMTTPQWVDSYPNKSDVRAAY